MQDICFKPRLIPALATLLAFLLFVHLGNWQADKGERRAAEIHQFKMRAQQGAYLVGSGLLEAASVQDAPVTVRGHYLPAQQFYIDNRQEDGKPGVYLVTPLEVSGSQTRVLINRGWLPWADRQSPLPTVVTPGGELQVSGIAAIPSSKKFFLMPDHQDERPNLWSRLDLDRFIAQQREPTQSFVILQSPGSVADGLVRHWPEPEDRVAMHRSYSMQWYGMAAALLIFFCVASVRKRDPT
jgi:cytochrome oxidase assembly protein ShyY1